MIELKKEELMKNRGYIATLGAGYHLLADNFKAIFRQTWIYVLLFALAMGGWTIIAGDMREDTPPLLGLAIIALFVIITATDILLYAKVCTMLNEQSMKWNIGRVTKVILFWFALAVVIGLIFVGWILVMGLGQGAVDPATMTDATTMPADQSVALLKIFGVIAVLTVIVMIFILPFLYPLPKYLMEPDKKLFSTMFGCYGRGLRYWGYIFVCILLLSLCIGIASLVFCLPMYVVQTVQNLNQTGILGGDESGLPGWFGWLNFGVSTATYFVYGFISLIEFFVAYYIYGSIETRIRERQKLTMPTEL